MPIGEKVNSNPSSKNLLAQFKLTFQSRYAPLALLAILAFAVGGIFFVSHTQFIDFQVYYLGGRSLWNGRVDIYTPDFSFGDVMDYRYPPLFLILFSPISLLPYFWAAYLWYWFCILQIAGCIFFVKRLLGTSEANQKKAFKKKVVWIIAFVALIQYFLISVKYGNAHLLVTVLLFGSFYFVVKKKNAAAALLMALAITIKLIPLLALPFFALKKQWTYLTLVTVFLVLLNLAPALYFGFGENIKLLNTWYEHVIENQETHERLTVINLSLKGQLQRSLSEVDYSQRTVGTKHDDVDYKNVNITSVSEAAVNRIWIIFSAILYAAGLFLIWLKPKTDDSNAKDLNDSQSLTPQQITIFEYGLMVCLMLVIAPLTSKIYFVMLLLPVAGLANYAFNFKSLAARIARYVLLFVAITNAVLPLLPGRTTQRLILVLGTDFYLTFLLTLTLMFVLAAGKKFSRSKPVADLS